MKLYPFSASYDTVIEKIYHPENFESTRGSQECRKCGEEIVTDDGQDGLCGRCA